MLNTNKQSLVTTISSALLLILTFSLLIVGFFHPITAMTQDLGRHLLTGNIILETGSVPQINLYTYTYPTFPFINTHWLSEVSFYLLQKSTGFTGLLITMTGIILLTFALLFYKGRHVASVPAMALASFFLLPILFERTDLRPEIFSFLLLSSFLVILYTYLKRETKLIYLLPVLSLLWVNLHIYFAIGILVTALFLLDLLIQNRKNLLSKKIITLVLVLLGCILATVVNPNGISGAIYPFNVFQNYGYTIEENQNIFFLQSLFNKPTILWFELGVVMLFTSLSLSWRKTNLIDWLLAVVFTFLGVSAVRNFPLFAIAAFIPLSTSLFHLSRKVHQAFEKKSQRLLSRVAVLSISGVLIWLLIITSTKYPLSAEVPTSTKNAVTYFTSHHLKGPIFNNFDIGSDLEYRLYPTEKTFVDGRPEAYPASFFKEIYIPMQQDQTLFHTLSQKYHFQTILISHTDQTPWAETFMGWITKDPLWKLTYLDDTMLLFEPSISTSPVLTDDPQAIIPYKGSRQSLLQLAHLYSIIGWPKSLEATLQEILTLDPHNCPVLYNLALLKQQRNDPTVPLLATTYQTYCR